MTRKTQFHFYIGHPPEPIGPTHSQWAAPLPLHRHAVGHDAQKASTHANLRYGDYFSAAADFLSRNRFGVPTRAAGNLLERDVEPDEIEHLRIHLAKHGAFYHPAKVTFQVGGTQIAMVLNVAVSTEGRAVLFQEHATLNRLNETYPKAYIPRVFGCSDSQINGVAHPVMFAAQWLEGYHEFHLTGCTQWVVWDDDTGHRILSAAQVRDLYRQAAMILTYYFHPFSLESILDWHHAAGDFVVRCMGAGVDVRLITVRRYAPLVSLDEGEGLTLQTLMDAMVIFFLNMSLRMRLDRLDGVGELVWAPEEIVRPVWEGFVAGLDGMTARHDLPDEFKQGILSYLRAHDSAKLMDLCQAMVERMPPKLQEAGLIQSGLQAHAASLTGCIQGQ